MDVRWLPPESFPRARLARPPLKPVLLWDGECGFCSWAVDVFERLTAGRVATAPVQPLLETLPPEVRATALDQLLFLAPSGEITGGVRAISRALRAGGRPWLGSPLEWFVLYPLFRLAYRAVARLRFLFPAPRVCRR